MKRCHLSFEMSSEDMLEICPQPADTCDHNHPLYNAMDYTYNDLRVMVADAPYHNGSIKPLDYDHEHIEPLQDAAGSFDDWFDGWRDVYQTHVSTHLTVEENEQLNMQIETIEKLLNKNSFYQNIDIHSQISELEGYVSDIEKSVEAACNAKSEHEDDIYMARQNIEELKHELDSASEDDVDYWQSSIDEQEAHLEVLEQSEPWEDHLYDANNAIDNYERNYEQFGPVMQDHYTALRDAISKFKVNVKHFIENLQQERKIDTLLPYPEDHLTEQMSEHSQKETIVVSATPTIFIKRVREMEINDPKLDGDEHELLISSDIDEYSLMPAMKRFTIDFPQYQRLLSFDDDQEAIKLGKRSFRTLTPTLKKQFDVEEEQTLAIA